MKKIFRKAITVLGSAALIGATVGAAAAAAVPLSDSFSAGSTAIVVGANAAPSDNVAAGLIKTNLDAAASGSTTTLVGASGVTEDEVQIGGRINLTTSSAAGKIAVALTDSKIDSLLDMKIRWDDGGASGADDYNIHEEIRVSNMMINTTLDDNDYAELLALTNDKAIEYRYVFETAFDNATAVGTDTADDLYLTILGQSYEISAMTATSISVVTSEEVSVGIGESVTVDGQTYTVSDLSSTSVKVNGETIASGGSKKIDGLQVQVKASSIFYNENFPESATVTLKIGTDISKTYTDGEEYIGEDEDDPLWVWTMSSDLTAVNAYIGVKYNQKETRDTDDVVYEGGSFILPENFGAVQFDGITDVTYSDFKVYFDAAEDLWNENATSSTANVLDSKVLIIESVDGVKDSIRLTNNSQETSKIYLRWDSNATSPTGGAKDVDTSQLELFYSDVDSTVQDAVKPRFIDSYIAVGGNTSIALTDLGDLIVGDTTVAMHAITDAAGMNITFTDGGTGQNITVVVGGVALAANAGEFKWFGGNIEGTDKEVGVSSDMVIGVTQVGTYDNDIMTTNGLIVQTPEANLDNDEVIISIPSDRVYAKISIVAGGDATTTGEAGAMTVMDSAVSTVAGKNLVVVGGSAINSVAAELLGSAYSEGAFTSATGVAAGEFLINSYDRAGKTALLVAGYNAADTEKAVTYLLNNDVDTTVGTKIKGTSATEATVVTA